jgi:hypothetical protein
MPMPFVSENWYQIYSTGHFGYPQPEDTWEETTYESAGYCARCGIGGVQRHPFRFRGGPKAAHSHFLQLNWVFDEFFTRPEVREVFEAEHVTGAGFGPALRHRTGEPLVDIEQLVILGILPPALVSQGLQTVTCRPNNEEPPWPVQPATSMRYPPDTPYCGRVKFHWPTTLRFRRSVCSGAPDLIKSAEWFGSGAQASRAVLASQRVVHIVSARRWRGLKWAPVDLVED